MNKGKIISIIAPVVDVFFPDALPSIYNALIIPMADNPGLGQMSRDVTLEVME